VTAVAVGAYVRTNGGGRGRVVDRRVEVSGSQRSEWWLVKLSTDKDALMWYRTDQLSVAD
jgi:hypothetical protein